MQTAESQFKLSEDISPYYFGGIFDQSLTLRISGSKDNFTRAHIFVTDNRLPVIELIDQQFPNLGSISPVKENGRIVRWCWRPDSVEHQLEFLEETSDYLFTRKKRALLLQDYLRLRVDNKKITGEALEKRKSLEWQVYDNFIASTVGAHEEIFSPHYSYLSGLFDVAGSLTIMRRAGDIVGTVVSLQSPDSGLISGLKNDYEDSIVFPAKTMGRLPSQVWEVTNEAAAEFLMLIEDQMIFRRKFANVLIEYQAGNEQLPMISQRALTEEEEAKKSSIINFREKQFSRLASLKIQDARVSGRRVNKEEIAA